MEGPVLGAVRGLVILRPFLASFTAFGSVFATKHMKQQILLPVRAALSHMTGSNFDRAN